MLKLLVFLAGAVAGTAGAVSWLLSEPGSGQVSPPVNAHSLEDRWQDLRRRWQDALAQGKRAGQETEERLRQELKSYRKRAG